MAEQEVSFARLIANAVIEGVKEKQQVVKDKIAGAKKAGPGSVAKGFAKEGASGGAGSSGKASGMDQVTALDIQVDVQELSTISAAGTAIISTEKAAAQAILRNV